MVQFVNGPIETLDVLLYKPHHEGTINYFSQQSKFLQDTLTNVGKSLLESASSYFNTQYNDVINQAARAAIRGINSIVNSSGIQYLDSLEAIRNASIIMQRWIMAEETIRNLYQKNFADGYSQTYVDMNRNKLAEDHYDYRRVMNNIIVETEDGWSAISYGDDLLYNDRELDFDEQVKILKTWMHVKAYAQFTDEDPTSTSGKQFKLDN